MKKRTTRERLIGAAAYLMHRRGYHHVSINDILKLAKAPKGVLYHHFPDGKPELGEAAINHAAALFNDDVEKEAVNAKTVSELIRLIGALTAKDLIETRYKAGCPLATAALETAPYDKRLTEACRKGFDLWIATIERHLTRLGVENPRKPAETILSAFEGALAIARTRKDIGVVTSTADTLVKAFQ